MKTGYSLDREGGCRGEGGLWDNRAGTRHRVKVKSGSLRVWLPYLWSKPSSTPGGFHQEAEVQCRFQAVVNIWLSGHVDNFSRYMWKDQALRGKEKWESSSLVICGESRG